MLSRVIHSRCIRVWIFDRRRCCFKQILRCFTTSSHLRVLSDSYHVKIHCQQRRTGDNGDLTSMISDSTMDEEVPFIEKDMRARQYSPERNWLLPWVLVFMLSAYIAATTALNGAEQHSESMHQRTSDFSTYRS